jgi:hypothetical protein
MNLKVSIQALGSQVSMSIIFHFQEENWCGCGMPLQTNNEVDTVPDVVWVGDALRDKVVEAS